MGKRDRKKVSDSDANTLKFLNALVSACNASITAYVFWYSGGTLH